MIRWTMWLLGYRQIIWEKDSRFEAKWAWRTQAGWVSSEYCMGDRVILHPDGSVSGGYRISYWFPCWGWPAVYTNSIKPKVSNQEIDLRIARINGEGVIVHDHK